MTMDGDQTRARLIAEARDLYLEEGLGRFSLREVARRAGISAPAIYRHYEGKEALLREVCSQGFRIFALYLARALDEKRPRERLVRAGKEYLRFALENPRDYRFMFMSAAEDVAAMQPVRRADDPDPTFQFLVDRVDECIQARVLKRGRTAPATARYIWAFVHGMASLRLSGLLEEAGDAAHFAAYYATALDQLLDGLAP
jgi:AcrR family transcriptional regulator